MKKDMKEMQKRSEILGINVKRADLVIAGITISFKTFVMLSTIFSIVVLGIALFLIHYLFSFGMPVNMDKYLKDIYRGEKFKIIEDYSNERGYGEYLLAPKSNKEITFRVYREVRCVKDDYYDRAFQYYMNHCPNKELVDRFEKIENKEKYKEIDFLEYQVFLNLPNVEQLEEYTKYMYEMIQYLEQQDKRCYFYILLRKGNQAISLRCHEKMEYEEFLKEAKSIFTSEKTEKAKEREQLENLIKDMQNN